MIRKGVIKQIKQDMENIFIFTHIYNKIDTKESDF